MAIKLSNNKHTATRVRSRLRRQVRGRKKISGTAQRPRLVVTRSAKHITVQVVDDPVGKTLAFASTTEKDLRSFDGDKTAKAKKVGELSPSAPRRPASTAWSSTAPATSTTPNIAALADGAREGGLTF